MTGLLIETVGIELEGLGITQEKLSALVSRDPYLCNRIGITHDASAELYIKKLRDNINVVDHNTIVAGLRGNKFVSGYEAVSVPLSFDETDKAMTRLMDILKANGEFFSPRASMHIHVGFAHNLSLMKTALLLGLYLDSLLFQLGAMGEEFRGSINESVYCRPLTGGQVAICGNRSKYRILSPEKALSATSLEDFWATYAVNPNRPPNRYIAGRYFAWNLFSVILHGTIEYRYFNQTLNVNTASAITRVCQAITELVLRLDLKGDVERVLEARLQNLPITESHPKEEYISQLVELIRLMSDVKVGNLPSETHVKTLIGLIESAKPVKLSSTPIKTHLKNYSIPEHFSPFLEKAGNKIQESGYIDIHNIKNFSILDTK